MVDCGGSSQCSWELCSGAQWQSTIYRSWSGSHCEDQSTHGACYIYQEPSIQVDHMDLDIGDPSYYQGIGLLHDHKGLGAQDAEDIPDGKCDRHRV